MIRITNKEAIAQIEAIVERLGAIPLRAGEDGLIVMTPELLRGIEDAAFNVVNHRGPGLEEWLDDLRTALKRLRGD